MDTDMKRPHNTALPGDFDVIQLADREYGNTLMREVAMEHLRVHPTLQFVEVREHAGWYLGYRRNGSIWTTANDGARLEPGAYPGTLRLWVDRNERLAPGMLSQFEIASLPLCPGCGRTLYEGESRATCARCTALAGWAAASNLPARILLGQVVPIEVEA